MNLRELTYRIYGEDRLSGKLDVITAASRRSNTALTKTSNLFGGLKQNVSSAAAELPFVGRGLQLISNPLVAVGGGLALIGKGLYDASEQAVKFNAAFRELQNLNMDKPRDEIQRIKNEVLNTAENRGFNAEMTSRGFYDVQSITGKMGFEAQQIVGKQGEFAKVMNADFNKWIEGTGKAMANYGFGADQLDRFNRSAYATVNLGAITYDELSKVQGDFAGAAASAQQSYESANKLMTLFTIKTKSANEAATLTKSAFQDLFKKSTIEAFQNAGVKMYDELTGGHRQVDEIMKDLNNRFMVARNDREVDQLRNMFSGSEGLTALIQAASDQSGNFLRTLQKFDGLEFNFAKAYKEAREDVSFLNEETKNLLTTTQIQLGQELMPFRLQWAQTKLEMAQGLNRSVKEAIGFFTGRDILQEEEDKKISNNIKSQYSQKLNTAHLMAPDAFEANQAELAYKYKQARDIMRRNAGFNNSDLILNYARENGNISIKSAAAQMEDTFNRWKSRADTYEELLKLFPEYRENPSLNPSASTAQQSGTKTDQQGAENSIDDPKITKGLSEISGGGQAVKSVNVDFGTLVENLNINTTTLTEGAPEVERKITELLIRALGGAEQMMQ